jgi:hypothetical protein
VDDALLQTIRQAPLFTGVQDDRLDSIRRGEVIQVPAGTIRVSGDEPAEYQLPYGPLYIFAKAR